MRGHRTYLNITPRRPRYSITTRTNAPLLRSIERARDWCGLNMRIE